MTPRSDDELLSIILLSYFSAENLASICNKIHQHLDDESIPHEIVIIDDGSSDNSFEVATKIAKASGRVRAYRLSKNFTSPFAVFAGMRLARGACAVAVPDDLQQPLAHVVRMYRAWQQGARLVVGSRSSRRDGWLSDIFSRTYYRLMNRFSDVRFPRGGADGFLADREIIDLLNQRIRPLNTSPIIEVLRMGYNPVIINYDRPPRSGRSRWTWKKKLRLAMDNFFGSSVFPIKFITYLGLLIFITCFLLTIIIIIARLLPNNTLFGFPIPGWTTTVVLITMFNGLILLCMGILAEYIWRIFEEVKDRPAYIIRKDDRKRDPKTSSDEPEQDHSSD